MSVAEPPVTTSAPARSRAETRRRLVAAGTELFAREGLHGVTSARIARQAGVATGTFYLHFKDKQALFREIVFAALEQLRARQARARAEAASDPLAQLRASTRELFAFAEEQRSLIRVLFGRNHEAAELGEDVLDEIVPGLEARLRELRESGRVPRDLEPRVAAQAIAAMTVRVVAWWVEDPTRAPRERVIDTITRLHPLHMGSTGKDPESHG